MNSNTEVSDDHIIQIPPDHTPNQSHEQTPIATSTNSPTPKHESRGVNQMTLEELSSLKEDLIRHVCGDQWLQLKSIIDKCPDMVRIPLNHFGDTALHLAVREGKGGIVKELVDCMRPEDMLIPNLFGDTALHLAVTGERLEIVKELVQHMRPEDMLIQNTYGNTALHLAVINQGSLDIVKELVQQMRPDYMLIQNSYGNTALHQAVTSQGSPDIVKELVQHMRPEDMLIIPNSFGDTALHLAITSQGSLEIVKELVNRMRPEYMRIPNSYGNTALHLALERNSLEIVNELVKHMRPEDMLIQNSYGNTALHLAVERNSLEIVKELVNRMRPEYMRIPNSYGNTALHLAVERNSLEIVNELVKRMRPEDMLIPNSYGNTALHLAVINEGSLEIVNELVKLMRPEDILIPTSDGMLPVHLAVSYGRPKDIVDILSSEEVLYKMDFKDIERLFMMTIRFDMFALRLFENDPTTLATARNEEDVTAVKMLGEKPRGMSAKESDVFDRLFGKVLTQVEPLEKKREDAIKSGNVEAVEMLLDNNPQLVTYRDRSNGWNLLHLVVLFRQKDIFNIIIARGLKEDLVRAVDYGGNNILHLAAHLPPVEFEEWSSLRASIQMQKELAWFKFVESNVHDGELRTMRNNDCKRPTDVFYDEHKKLSQEIKDAAKGIAESGMLVSTLVATVAFAAALTVPGDKTNAWFTVFILTNAFLLCTSSASLLTFFRYLTSSRVAQYCEYVISLHPSLTFGLWLLNISIVAMPLAFIAASFLIFDHTSKWASYAVTSMGLFPILILLFQFNFLDKHLWSKCYRLPKLD